MTPKSAFKYQPPQTLLFAYLLSNQSYRTGMHIPAVAIYRHLAGNFNIISNGMITG